MDNLAPPPPYRSQDGTPQILDIQNHLQSLLHTAVPLYCGDLASEPKRKAPLQQQVGDFDMRRKSYLNVVRNLRGTIDSENRNEDTNAAELQDAQTYKSTDPSTLEYLNSTNSYIPYSINTVHLQNPYKQVQTLEGYAPRRAGLKNMYRAKESNVRPRRNNFAARQREENVPASVDIGYVKDNDKLERSRTQRNECRFCLKKNEVGLAAQQYCLSSTLHGLRYVGDASLSILERLFWVVSVILAFVASVYYIWNLYQRWTDSPLIISLSPESMPLVEIPFPSITVCNMNNAKKTEADRINQGRENLEKLLLNDICNFENGSLTSEQLDSESGKWSNVQRFMINVTQPCTDMLYLCRWHENTTDCEKIFNPTLTDEGICCNFNAVHRKHLFYNPRDMSDLNVTFPFTSVDWTPEKGYPPKTPTDSIPWRPYGAGRHLGLTLVLDAEVHEYYCSSAASVGFKMLLHNPVETPKIADFAFSITPGEETRIVIRPTITSASRSIIRVPRKKRRCFFTSERSLRYYRTYTQRNCILECEANFTQQICNCVQHYMPKSARTKICGKKDDKCANQARLAMELKLYDDENTTSLLNVSQTPSCNCWPGCFEINYNSELSQSKLVRTFDVNSDYVKRNVDYYVENIAVVHLYFVDSQFTAYVKNELFGFTELLSNTGGLLGLFMGFSFLSLVEIIYFVTLRLWCRMYRQNTSPTHTLLRVGPAAHQNAIVYPFAQ